MRHSSDYVILHNYVIQINPFNINSIEMLHEKVGKDGTRNRGRYQVAQI